MSLFGGFGDIAGDIGNTLGFGSGGPIDRMIGGAFGTAHAQNNSPPRGNGSGLSTTPGQNGYPQMNLGYVNQPPPSGAGTPTYPIAGRPTDVGPEPNYQPPLQQQGGQPQQNYWGYPNDYNGYLSWRYGGGGGYGPPPMGGFGGGYGGYGGGMGGMGGMGGGMGSSDMAMMMMMQQMMQNMQQQRAPQGGGGGGGLISGLLGGILGGGGGGGGGLLGGLL